MAGLDPATQQAPVRAPSLFTAQVHWVAGSSPAMVTMGNAQFHTETDGIAAFAARRGLCFYAGGIWGRDPTAFATKKGVKGNAGTSSILYRWQMGEPRHAQDHRRHQPGQ